MHFTQKEYNVAVTTLIVSTLIWLVAPAVALLFLLVNQELTQDRAIVMWIIIAMATYGLVGSLRRRIRTFNNVQTRRTLAHRLYGCAYRLTNAWTGLGDPTVRFDDATFTFQRQTDTHVILMKVSSDEGVDLYQIDDYGLRLSEDDELDIPLPEIHRLIDELQDRIKVFEDEQHESPIKVRAAQRTLV